MAQFVSLSLHKIRVNLRILIYKQPKFRHEGTFGIFGEKKIRYVTAPGSIHKTKNIKDD